MSKYILAIIITICSFGTHYLDAQEIIFEQGQPELAEYQLKFFYTIMNNEQALQLFSQESENPEIKMIEHSTPEYLYKIVSQDQWQKSLLQNVIITSSIDEDFIHLAKEEQIAHVVQKFWNNMDYIVLKLASKKLVGRLIYETNPGGSTQYYHLYDGNIPLNAVVDVTVVRYNQ